jgi:hypothetical protein
MTQRLLRGRKFQLALVGFGAGISCAPAWATDIIGVLPAALDQPRVYAIIRPAADANPYIYEDFDPFTGDNVKGFNIDPAYLDTGASGVLLSGDVADLLKNSSTGVQGLPLQTYTNKQVYYEDVGVNGADRFKVTAPFSISIAPFHPNSDVKIADAQDQYTQTNSFSGVDLSFYSQSTNNIRATLTKPDDPNNPSATGPLNVLGIPVMKNKVAVKDLRPVNSITDTMRTYLYDRGTPANPAHAADDPGIPKTTRTIKLSYGSFDQFTRTGTLDNSDNLVPLPPDQLAANIPTLDHNPFIGPNPVNPTGDNTPPVKIEFNNLTASGSFLLDTGAAASMISTHLADQLHVRYRPNTQGTDQPILETYDPGNPTAQGQEIQDQFQLDIGGVGGTSRAAGFFLSSLLVKTTEGNAADDHDPKHFRFIDAPVLVNDITLRDPNSPTTLTLDGIFGMNFLTASTLIQYTDFGGGIVVPLPVLLGQGAFDWAVFDEAAGVLKLRPSIPADANRDGLVNFDDLLALAKNYNKQPQTDDPVLSADFNGDGITNFDDLLILAKHYNLTDLSDSDKIQLAQYDFNLFGDMAAAAAAGVPEPTTGGLLLAACAAPLLGRRNRRRRACAIPNAS